MSTIRESLSVLFACAFTIVLLRLFFTSADSDQVRGDEVDL